MIVQILQLTFYSILIGFVIDLLIGDPHFLPHPVILIGKLISGFEKAMRKIFPKTPRGEFVGGMLMAFFVCIVSAGVPLGLLWLCFWLHPYAYLALSSVFCWQILAAHALRAESMKVYKKLKEGDVEGARYAVSMIVGRDTSVLDEAGITRAAVETVAENSSDGVIAPLLYLFLGGAVGGFLYKAINTMDSMVGYKENGYLYFGRFAAKTDDVFNFIPARISALFLWLASVVLQYRPIHAWKIYWRDRKKHASPNSAQTEAVCAGALGLRLAGDAIYHGVLHKKEFIGDDLRPICAFDIVRANRLMYLGVFLALAVLSALYCILLFVILA